MLTKEIVPQEMEQEIVHSVIPGKHSGVKCANAKTGECGKACVKSNMTPDLDDFVAKLKPDAKYLYLHIIALGSGEAFGPNINGDYFPEEGLLRKHPTFVTNAKHYKHHINKNPKISYGHPVFSTYNKPMRRVELILAVDKAKAPDLVSRVENGDKLGYSMACKVPRDYCSICGNAAKVKADYCSHIRNELLDYKEDGKQVYMINSDPTFFDISYVLRPADKTAMLLRKVAACSGGGKENKIKEIYKKLDKVDKIKDNKALSKKGTLRKKIELEVTPILNETQYDKFEKVSMAKLNANNVELPIEKIAQYNISDILSTLSLDGVFLSEGEFNKIANIKSQDESLLHKRADIDAKYYNDDLHRDIQAYIPNRSVYTSFIVPKLEKLAGVDLNLDVDVKDTIMTGGGVGAAYLGYKRKLGSRLYRAIANLIKNNTGKFIVLAGVGAAGLKLKDIAGKQIVTDSLSDVGIGDEYIIPRPDIKYSSVLNDMNYRGQEIFDLALQPFGVAYINSFVTGKI